jgi:hypothetical protein
MRPLGLVAAVVFLVPLAGFAQHSAAPAPAHVSATASHISSAPSAGVHTPGISRNPGAPSPSGGHAVAKASPKPNTPHANHKTLLEPSANSRAQNPGLFAFVHRGKHDKCKHGCGVPSPSGTMISQADTVTPVASEAHVGCRILPVPNSGIPCNPFSPCCP